MADQRHSLKRAPARTDDNLHITIWKSARTGWSFRITDYAPDPDEPRPVRNLVSEDTGFKSLLAVALSMAKVVGKYLAGG